MSNKEENFKNNNIVNIDWNNTENFNETMIRAKELSKIFIGTSQATYNNWYKEGYIVRYKICGSVYYKLSEIRQLIENSKEYRKAV